MKNSNKHSVRTERTATLNPHPGGVTCNSISNSPEPPTDSQTKQNIRRYQEQLPNVKGKVIAALWMMILSVALMVGTSFAWYTLTQSPEVTGLSTTITGNGSLEIALSDADGLEPEESKIGDSIVATGQDVAAANLTWGNLINLSDSSYGLSYVELRPSVLNLISLLTNPLQAVDYGSDGRVTRYQSNFGYAAFSTYYNKFIIPVDDDGQQIMEYGVRAISSVTYENNDGDADFGVLQDAATSKLAQVETDYTEIVNNESYLNSLAGLIGVYLTGKLNSTDPDCSDYIEDLYDMAVDLQEAYEELGEAYCAIAEMQQFTTLGKGNYTAYTVDTLVAAGSTELANNGISISSLSTYKSDRSRLATYVQSLYDLYAAYRDNGTAVTWKSISSAVNFIVDINTCTIDGTPLSRISAGNASSYLGKTCEVKITNGMIYRFECQIQSRMYVTGLQVSVTYTISTTVTGNISTTAGSSMTAYTDYSSAASYSGAFIGTDPVAEDTYALAIDFWVRSNAELNYLILEGDVIYDIDGNVTGYVGDNRIWQDYISTTDGIATTQGSGSCYVFTCEDPADYERIKELLKSFTVAFIDADGNLLAYADMDTDNIWEDSGRFVVPLTLRATGDNYVDVKTNSTVTYISYYDSEGHELATQVEDGVTYYYYIDEEGNTVLVEEADVISEETEEPVTERMYYIAKLRQNVAQRITAIIYLDGQRLTNSEVMAAAGFEGQLNIQFGGTATLEPVDNDELYDETISISASASSTQLDYDTAESDADLTSTITVNISGDVEPKTVTAYFLRAINDYQGTKQETLTFTSQGDGTWTADMVFAYPGQYKLSYITVDGREYALSTPVEVIVDGFELGGITWDYSDSTASVFTGDSSTSVGMSLYFAKTDTEVSSIRALFLSEDGKQVSVTFKQTAGTIYWAGTASFTSSGTYTLTYIYIDGEAYEVPESMGKTLEATLGVTARIWLSSDAFETNTTRFTLKDDYASGADVSVQVRLYDNNGSQLTDLGSTLESGEKLLLTYGLTSGSRVLDTDLTWNGDTGYYEGQFRVEASGVYTFRSVTVGSTSIITKYTNAPNITAISPDPPSYVGNSTETYQLALSGGAVIVVDIANSNSASVSAEITNSGNGGRTYTVVGTPGGDYYDSDGILVTQWTFLIPDGVNGAQDGNWQLTELILSDFYRSSDNTYVDSALGESEIWDVANEDIVTKVVETVEVTFPEGQSYVFGKTGDEVTGYFMDSYDPTFLLQISDFEGEALDVTDISLTLTHTLGSESDYGNYTAEELDGTNATGLEIYTLTLSGTDTEYTASATMCLAGAYTATDLSFKVSGKAYSYTAGTMPKNAPAVEIYSQSPTVKVTGTNPAPSETFSINLGSGTNEAYWETHNYFEDFYAYLGIVAESGCGSATYTAPQVTLTLSNAGSSFTSTIFRAVASSTYDCDFTFAAGETSVTDYMGRIGDGDTTSGSDTRYSVNGTYSSVYMTYGGVTYTVQLTDAVQIKTSNTALPSLSYIDLEGYEGYVDLPETDEGNGDGRSFTVTLPEVSDFTITGDVTGELGEFTTTTDTSTVYYYVITSSGCSSTRTYYPYTRTTVVEVAQAEKVNATITYRVVGWTVQKATLTAGSGSVTTTWGSGTYYAVGSTITVSGVWRAIPVLEEVSRVVNSTETATYTRTTITDVAQATATEAPSGGTKVDSEDIHTTAYVTESWS